MAAPTQTAANKAGGSPIAYAEATSGVIMFRFPGGISFGAGAGTPNAYVTAEKGSIWVDDDAPLVYQNTDGGTTWETVYNQS